MEIFGLVVLLTLAVVLFLAGVGTLITAVQNMASEDTSNQAAGGCILCVIGIALFLLGGDWFLNHYDIVRTR